MRRLLAWLGAAPSRAAAAWASPRAPVVLAALAGVVALVPRLDFALREHPPRLYLFGDMAIYLERGAALTQRARTAWDTFTPVGYPALLSLLHVAAPGDLSLVAVCHAVLGALTASLTALFAYRLDRSPAVALIAGLATALYFPLIFYTGFVLTETTFAFLLVLFVWLELRALERGRAALGLAAGVVLGLAILVRPSLLAFLPCVVFCAVRRAGHDRRVAGATLLASALVLAPVSAHTSWLLGRPALVATNGGVNFFLAHSECRSVRSTAGGEIVEVSTHFNRTHFERRCERPEPFHDEGAYYRAGLVEIAEHPSRLLRAWKGVAEGVGLAPRRAWPHQPFWPGSMEHAGRLGVWSWLYAPLVLLPALAHALARARAEGSRARSLAWAILASVGVVLYVYNGNPRVRVSSDPLALALAASAWTAAARRLIARFRGEVRQGASPSCP